jgi:hypothetical protein
MIVPRRFWPASRPSTSAPLCVWSVSPPRWFSIQRCSRGQWVRSASCATSTVGVRVSGSMSLTSSRAETNASMSCASRSLS